VKDRAGVFCPAGERWVNTGSGEYVVLGKGGNRGSDQAVARLAEKITEESRHNK